MVKVNLIFTPSKLLAYLILIIGSVYGFYFKDANVLIATFSAASAVIGVKTWAASRERIKETEYRTRYNENGNVIEKEPDNI